MTSINSLDPRVKAVLFDYLLIPFIDLIAQSLIIVFRFSEGFNKICLTVIVREKSPNSSSTPCDQSQSIVLPQAGLLCIRH